MERGHQGGWEGARCALGVGLGEAGGQGVYQEGDTWCPGRRAGSHSVVAKVPVGLAPETGTCECWWETGPAPSTVRHAHWGFCSSWCCCDRSWLLQSHLLGPPGLTVLYWARCLSLSPGRGHTPPPPLLSFVALGEVLNLLGPSGSVSGGSEEAQQEGRVRRSPAPGWQDAQVRWAALPEHGVWQQGPDRPAGLEA